MKIRKVLGTGIALSLAMLGLASCNGGNNGTSANTPSSNGGAQASSSAEASLILVDQCLQFLNDGNFRIDVMDSDLGITFNYGNRALTNKEQCAFADNSTLAYSGTPTVDTICFLLVTETKTSTSFISDVSGNQALSVSQLSRFLQTISNVENKQNEKFYLAISKSTEDPKWTKNLSAAMDEKITAWINSDKEV